MVSWFIVVFIVDVANCYYCDVVICAFAVTVVVIVNSGCYCFVAVVDDVIFVVHARCLLFIGFLFIVIVCCSLSLSLFVFHCHCH